MNDHTYFTEKWAKYQNKLDNFQKYVVLLILWYFYILFENIMQNKFKFNAWKFFKKQNFKFITKPCQLYIKILIVATLHKQYFLSRKISKPHKETFSFVFPSSCYIIPFHYFNMVARTLSPLAYVHFPHHIHICT